MSTMRCGIGWDVHRLAPGSKLLLGGVEIESPVGAVGHSDADVLAHAITDAILGALSAGDIGQHFPDSDPRWAGASSSIFLKEAIKVAKDKGYIITHVDATVILQKPRLGPYRQAIRENLARLLELPIDAVSVKFKSAEGLGPVGAGQAIEAMAIVTLQDGN